MILNQRRAMSFIGGSAIGETKPHIHGLDGLRGVAAFIVLVLHGSQLLKLGYEPPSAGLAVDFFFLLSGFVIAFAYDDRLAKRQMSWRRFMLARLIRLYPMLFIGTVLGGAVFLLENAGSAHGISGRLSAFWCLGSFLLLPVGFTVVPGADGYYHYNAYPLNNPVWSLVFEFAINALYGSGLGRFGPRRLAAVVIASGAALTITIAFWPFSFNYIGFLSPAAFVLGFVRVSYPFWIGVLICRAASFRAMPGLPTGVIGVFLAIALLLPYSGKAYTECLLLLAFPVLMELGAAAQSGGATARLCSVLGDVSYPLYLVHQPIFRALKLVSDHLHSSIPSLVVLAIGAALSAATAYILLVWVDRPVRKWLTRQTAAFTPCER